MSSNLKDAVCLIKYGTKIYFGLEEWRNKDTFLVVWQNRQVMN